MKNCPRVFVDERNEEERERNGKREKGGRKEGWKGNEEQERDFFFFFYFYANVHEHSTRLAELNPWEIKGYIFSLRIKM